MPQMTVGDFRQDFLLRRANIDLKERLNTLVDELSTGRVADIARTLGASQSSLASIDRDIARLEAHAPLLSLAANDLSVMQTALDSFSATRESAVSRLVNITGASSPQDRENAASEAELLLNGVVGALNAQMGGRSLFSGTTTETPPFSSAADLLDQLRSDVAGATDLADLQAQIDAWFGDPGGGFETFYQGNAVDDRTLSLTQGERYAVDVRADDPAFRDMLKAAATAVLATDAGLPLSVSDRTTLQQESGAMLLTSAQQVAAVQSRLGALEARVATEQAQQAAELSAFQIMRNDMVAADPFGTAAALQEVQTQLETHYALTARLSRLSLTEYL